jgi:hypothetical protein
MTILPRVDVQSIISGSAITIAPINIGDAAFLTGRALSPTPAA